MISAVVVGTCFCSSAHANVNPQDIFDALIQAVPPPPGIINFSNDVAIKQTLQRLLQKPDGSFDVAYARKLGFDRPINELEDSIRQASTLFPIALFRIGLKQLQNYQPGQDPLTLLSADVNWLFHLPPPLPPSLIPARYLFAIAVKDTSGQTIVQSSVRLAADFSANKLNFRIERFGSDYLIRQVDKWRRVPDTTGPISKEYFLVWIPALNRYYLGKLQAKTFLIKTITEDLQVGLKEGEEGVAKDIFLRLRPEALTINADDPNAPPR